MEIDSPPPLSLPSLPASPPSTSSTAELPTESVDSSSSLPTTPPSSSPSTPAPPPIPTTSSPLTDQTPRAKRRLTEPNRPLNPFERHAFEVEDALARFVQYLVTTTTLITDLPTGTSAITKLLTSPVISCDCEGVNLGDRNNGKVTLVQISDMTGEVFLFDVQTEPLLGDELRRILESEEVMHDCTSDSKGLLQQFQIQLNNVFDTQAAHRVIQKRNLGPNEKEEKNVGLDKICRTYGGPPSPFKDAVKGVYKKNQTFWAARPLTELMISYAASDVLCLLPAVYENLKLELTSEEDLKLFGEYCKEKVNPPVVNKTERNQQQHHNRGKQRGFGEQRGRGGRGRGGFNYYRGGGDGLNNGFYYDHSFGGYSGGDLQQQQQQGYHHHHPRGMAGRGGRGGESRGRWSQR
ncbi:egalitarian protein homolog isoform X2 [Folsomia candida]|uniref:egalitarian protein homolog isoform X2 n=1 Tax=Folsomia candida TaxID=158441 RepID=UPI001604D2F1|nr:egalitarian protein homolog isoform X2 [Folsomia candida]